MRSRGELCGLRWPPAGGNAACTSCATPWPAPTRRCCTWCVRPSARTQGRTSNAMDQSFLGRPRFGFVGASVGWVSEAMRVGCREGGSCLLRLDHQLRKVQRTISSTSSAWSRSFGTLRGDPAVNPPIDPGEGHGVRCVHLGHPARNADDHLIEPCHRQESLARRRSHRPRIIVLGCHLKQVFRSLHRCT